MGQQLTIWIPMLMLPMVLLVTHAQAGEPFVILASPSLEKPLVALAETFEASHPNVRVKILLDSGFALRGTIGRLQNSGLYGIESGVIHIVAPADQELIDRLEHRHYVMPDSRQEYATSRLALVVPASAPVTGLSFEEVLRLPSARLVVADPQVSELGHRTKIAFENLGGLGGTESRRITAHDAHGVLDRLAYGKADVGVLFEHQAVEAGQSVRLVAPVPEVVAPPIVYAMAMERFCPNRPLCREFLEFSRSPEARTILTRLGYGIPSDRASTRPTPGMVDVGGMNESRTSVPTESVSWRDGWLGWVPASGQSVSR